MPEKPSEHWYEKAADAMVREGKSLFAYSNEADLGLTNRECENIAKTKAFLEVLRVRRNLYYKELANDPSMTRAAVKGQLVLAVQKLIENGQFDKAANAIMQLAKLEGWTSDGNTTVNILQELTNGDLKKLKERFTPKTTSTEKMN